LEPGLLESGQLIKTPEIVSATKKTEVLPFSKPIINYNQLINPV
jgi:hypothetical protein